MNHCERYVGPSVTGAIHVMECRQLMSGKFVTVKIVETNYITDDTNAIGGKNAMMIGEVAITGIVV
jgi:hypothetical protein